MVYKTDEHTILITELLPHKISLYSLLMFIMKLYQGIQKLINININEEEIHN